MGDHSGSQKPTKKVVAATGGSLAGSTAGLLAVVSDMPQWAQVLVVLFGPPLATLVSGYAARQAAPVTE